MNLLAIALVGAGGAVGSVLRYVTVSLAGRWLGLAFPYGTLAVNILGSFAMGLLVGLMAVMLPEKGRQLHLLLAVGVLGGFTTFSAFSLDAVSLLQRGETLSAALYILASVVLSLLALAGGMALMKGMGA